MYEFTTISLCTLVRRNFRLNCFLKKELRRYFRRSIFPPKAAISTPFQAVLPHLANKSALRAEGPPTFWHAGNAVSPSTLPNTITLVESVCCVRSLVG